MRWRTRVLRFACARDFWFEKGETNFIRFAEKKDSVLFFYGSAEAP